ncbi:TPA: GNAT family N-acetyltransferase [Enterobacter hormaechei subsp. steigerwaltii]|nr:GNAT family N-acetyltransferase [Enterobacter hormaechei subsp. steigerwaltii]
MSSHTYLVSPATEKDIEDLVALRSYILDGGSNGSYVSHNVEDSIQWRIAYRKWLNQVLETDDNIRVLIAKNDGVAVGCATGIIDRRAPARDCIFGFSGWVQSVVVVPPWRHHGIARQLMLNLFDWFTSKRVPKIVLEATHEAESFYESLEFIRSPENLFFREDTKS